MTALVQLALANLSSFNVAIEKKPVTVYNKSHSVCSQKTDG